MTVLKQNAKFIIALLTAVAAYLSTVITDENVVTLITAAVGAVVVWLTPNTSPPTS
jgi:hypothetical protein